MGMPQLCRAVVWRFVKPIFDTLSGLAWDKWLILFV